MKKYSKVWFAYEIPSKARNIMKKLLISVAIAWVSLGTAYAQNVLEAITLDSGGRVSASLLVLETRQSLWILPDAAAPMQGVYHLPITMAALAAVDQNKFKLDQKIHVTKDDLVASELNSAIRDQHPDGNFKISLKELMHAALIDSDSTASDVLLRLVGGPTGVMQYLEQLGIRDIKIMDSENDMAKSWKLQYRNTATPKAMISLLQTIQQGKGLSSKSHALLMKWMMEADTSTNRIKALLPAGTPLAHKSGSSVNRAGVAAATNDVGIVTLPNGHHMATAIFLTDSTAPSASRELTIAKVAKVGWDAWAGK